MTDTALILQEIKLLREAVEALRPKRAKQRRRANPSLEEVVAYAMEKGRQDLAKRFYDYYTDGRDNDTRWTNAGGKPIYIWKTTFMQWMKNNELESNREYGRSEL